jgi:hypothetical protein
MSGMRGPWSKSVGGDFDRIDLSTNGGHPNSWLEIEMRVGNDVERRSITLRSDEAVRDLHYALGRYIAHMEKPNG